MRTGPKSTFESMVEQGAPISEIAAHIDGLHGMKKVDEVRSLPGRLMGRLWDASTVQGEMTPAELVPESTPAGATVTLQGRNSLPAFTFFRKRVARTADGLVFGYNDSLSRIAVGPGYFNVLQADGAHAGELLFEYMQPPPFEPAGWPTYRSNARGLSIFVYNEVYDFVRRVAQGVMIGSAYRRGVKWEKYFVVVKG
jgi:hypothetical protein